MRRGGIRAGHRKRDGVEDLPMAAMEPRDRMLRLRLTIGQHEAWKRAAQTEGRSVSEMVRHVTNVYAREALRNGGLVDAIRFDD